MSKRQQRRDAIRDKRQRQNALAREAERRVDAQKKAEAVRGKYGPKRRPAPVTVKSLETGEVLEVVDQARWKKREYSELLNRLAVAAGFESYAAYLDSPYWKDVRDRVMNRDRHRCKRCGGRERLSVHHDRYDYVGNERLGLLRTLCFRCHGKVHK